MKTRSDSSGRGGVEAAGFFEWGGRSLDGRNEFERKRPGWEKPIHPLLVENNVAVVFHGHDHLFAKQDLEGIVYQAVPQPAHGRYGNIRNAEAYGYVRGDVLAGSGHLRVMVAEGKVEVEYVSTCLPRDESDGRRNGAVAYAYTILAD